MADYVNNKDLLQAIVDWKTECRKAGHVVQQSDFIGTAIMKIAHGLSSYWKFSGYTNSWKEEMISDAVESAINGLINFDETKYSNPHAYITMACYNAFLQRIKKEKQSQAVKYSFFVHNVYDSRDPEMASIADENFIQDIYDKMNQYETNKKPSSKKIKEEGPNLDFLYDESN